MLKEIVHTLRRTYRKSTVTRFSVDDYWKNLQESSQDAAPKVVKVSFQPRNKSFCSQ